MKPMTTADAKRAAEPIDYLSPDVPAALPHVEVPLVRASPESLAGYGVLVDDHRDVAIEIVPWPVQGWRPLDAGTGSEGGTVSGTFDFWWQGELLYGRNQAVDGRYLLGWSRDPGEASAETTNPERSHLLHWHANYHPDGGQLFFPLDGCPFVTMMAPPGDDLEPESFTAFYCDGSQGLYIHPGVWHEAIIPLRDRGRFYDEQGRVHGRVSCNFAQEFGVFLSVPLRVV
jgi:hypothetical protein